MLPEFHNEPLTDFSDPKTAEAFQKAHRQGRSTAGTILGPPKFVGWEAVL